MEGVADDEVAVFVEGGELLWGEALSGHCDGVYSVVENRSLVLV